MTRRTEIVAGALRARAGHVRPDGDELEVSYTFLPQFWGRGYAKESVKAVLGWAAEQFPEEPIVICTQTANVRALRLAERLGFIEVDRLNEFGFPQWFGRLPEVRDSVEG